MSSPSATRTGHQLDVTDVDVSFGGVRALNNVTFTVEPGSIHGLIGPNGAGKTTLINLISGWLGSPARGSVRVDARDISDMRPMDIAAQRVARTYQHIRLFGHLSVVENVIVGLHLARRGRTDLRRRRSARQRAQELLASVGIDEGLDRDASELPYGVQRRVEVARALAIDPALLLLDEPVAGMNDAESHSISSLIEEVRGRGTTILVVEHNMAFVRATCDAMTVLDFGRVIASGSPEACLASEAVQLAYLGTGRRRTRDIAEGTHDD